MNNNLTLKSLENILNRVYRNNRNNFVIYCSEKIAKVYDITIKEQLGLISPEIATIERYADIKNAYLYPKWNYLKYPQVYFDNLYRDSHTNEMFEEGEEDIYGDYELIYTSKVTCNKTETNTNKWIDIISSGIQIKNPHDTVIY